MCIRPYSFVARPFIPNLDVVGGFFGLLRLAATCPSLSFRVPTVSAGRRNLLLRFLFAHAK